MKTTDARTSTSPSRPTATVRLALALGSSFDHGAFKQTSTCDDPEMDYSPALAYHAGPGAILALTMVDLTIGKVHWIQTGLDGSSAGVAEHTLSPGAKEWPNDFKEASYDGPCPPATSTHRYRLTLYSLKAPVDLSAAKTPAAAVAMLAAAAIDHAEVIATYRRR